MSATSGRVLLVEDSATQAARTQAILMRAGHDVVVAASGEEALQLFARSRFDIVISDIEMPGIDGYELCKRLRAESGRHDLPLLLFSSLSAPTDVIRALESGADSFLNKGAAAEVLVSRVTRMLDGRAVRSHPRSGDAVQVLFQGHVFTISAPRAQILDMLLSAFEDLSLAAAELRDREQQLRDANLELARRLRHDPLTELPNRVAFYEQTESLLSAAIPQSWALLLIDLDKFKEVNDTFGHQAGDTVLRVVAERMAGALGDTATVVRLGGDEFAAILPGADQEGAERSARSLIAAVGGPIDLGGRQAAVLASIGIALFPEDGLDQPAMLRAADLALYAAKGNTTRIKHASEVRAGTR